VLRDVNIIGNTVLDEATIRGVVDPYLSKPVTIGDLEEIRRQFTLLYINRGYINSGAIIPDQNVANGVVAFRFVEGRANDIEVSGTEHFDPEYFRSRLARGTEPPFNVENLGREQQILLQSPLVRRLNLELLPGLEPGEARLHADVLEANRFSLNAQIADDQSPTVGAVRGQLQGSAANLLGFSDILTAQYGRSQGLNDGYVGYSVPIASDDTRVSVRYDRNGVVVVTPDLSPLSVTSSFSSVGVGLSRPIYRTPEQAFTVGASLERRQQQTFLLGMPFPFTAGAEPKRTDCRDAVALLPGLARPRCRTRLCRPVHLQLRTANLGRHSDRYADPRHADSPFLLVARPSAICPPDLRGLGGIAPLRSPARQSAALSNGADRVRRARLGPRLSHVFDGDR
jgi:hemolysin activation/secretion protein